MFTELTYGGSKTYKENKTKIYNVNHALKNDSELSGRLQAMLEINTSLGKSDVKYSEYLSSLRTTAENYDLSYRNANANRSNRGSQFATVNSAHHQGPFEIQEQTGLNDKSEKFIIFKARQL